VVDAYLREVVNMESDQRRVRLSELDRAVAEKEADVLRDHEELIKMAAVLGTSETGTLTPKQKLALADLESARRELSGMKSELRHLKTDLASQKALLQDTDIFKKLREEVKAEKLATIQAEVKRLEAAIAATTADQQSLQQEVQRIRKSAESFGRVTANMKLIQSTLKNAEAALASLSTERDKVRVECRRPVRIQLFVPAHSAPPSPPNPKCPTEKK
jgi:chromosome segregation ATPase